MTADTGGGTIAVGMSDYAEFDLDPRLMTVVGGYIEADRTFTEAGSVTVDAETFKAAMRMLASGVVMVTARVDDRLWGLTISACCSISTSPPQVLISLARGASSRSAILSTRRFGLSILRAGQKSLAELGALAGGPKYVDAFCEESGSPELGSSMIAGCLYHLDCSVEQVVEVSDHTLIIGNVERAVSGGEDDDDDSGPLLYFDRTFHALGNPIE